jgi:hypothetical protein
VSDPGRLDGNVAVITGAASFITGVALPVDGGRTI